MLRRNEMEKENEIRIIAYALWAQDGYNRRSAVRHWLKAETIWQQNQKLIHATEPPKKDSEKVVVTGTGQENKSY
jgi:hypothetical protein